MTNILLFFMQGIPESMGHCAFSLAVARVPLRWGIIAVVGTVLTVIIFIIRSLPFTFGIHVAVAMLLLVFFIIKATWVSLTKSLIATFTSFATLAVLELVIYEIFFSITKLEFQAVIANNFLWKLLGLPQVALMIVFALLLSKYKIPEKGAWKI